MKNVITLSIPAVLAAALLIPMVMAAEPLPVQASGPIEGDKKPEGAETAKASKSIVQPAGAIPKPRRADATHVLIVTGNDYP